MLVLYCNWLAIPGASTEVVDTHVIQGALSRLHQSPSLSTFHEPQAQSLYRLSNRYVYRRSDSYVLERIIISK